MAVMAVTHVVVILTTIGSNASTSCNGPNVCNGRNGVMAILTVIMAILVMAIILYLKTSMIPSMSCGSRVIYFILLPTWNQVA